MSNQEETTPAEGTAETTLPTIDINQSKEDIMAQYNKYIENLQEEHK